MKRNYLAANLAFFTLLPSASDDFGSSSEFKILYALTSRNGTPDTGSRYFAGRPVMLQILFSGIGGADPGGQLIPAGKEDIPVNVINFFTGSRGLPSVSRRTFLEDEK